MKFLTFIRHSESHRQSGPPPALLEAMGKFVQRSLKDGTLVETGGLLPSKDGARVRLANGKLTVTDGPFTESKEIVGGFAILNAKSKADAIQMAKDFLSFVGEGECELRQIYEQGGPEPDCVKLASEVALKA